MRTGLLAVAFLPSLALCEQLSDWPPPLVIPLRARLHHVQGIDVEGDTLWVSSVSASAGKGYLSMFDLSSGKLISQVEVQDGRRIHPGGVALEGDSVWVPVAEYDRDGPTTVQRRDKRTLALLGAFTVEDHIGCIAATNGYLVGGNWDSRLLYRWSRSGRELSRLQNQRNTAYQDIKIVNGRLVAAGVVSREEGAIEWLSMDDYSLISRIQVGKTNRGALYTREGMACRGGRIYLLPEDDPSRLFVFTPQR